MDLDIIYRMLIPFFLEASLPNYINNTLDLLWNVWIVEIRRHLIDDKASVSKNEEVESKQDGSKDEFEIGILVQSTFVDCVGVGYHPKHDWVRDNVEKNPPK